MKYTNICVCTFDKYFSVGKKGDFWRFFPPGPYPVRMPIPIGFSSPLIRNSWPLVTLPSLKVGCLSSLSRLPLLKRQMTPLKFIVLLFFFFFLPWWIYPIVILHLLVSGKIQKKSLPPRSKVHRSQQDTIRRGTTLHKMSRQIEMPSCHYSRKEAPRDGTHVESSVLFAKSLFFFFFFLFSPSQISARRLSILVRGDPSTRIKISPSRKWGPT